MNQGRFYGLLIRGGQPLTIAQRIGFLLVATLLCMFGLLNVLSTFPQIQRFIGGEVLGRGAASIIYLPVAALVFFAGIRIIWTAVRPSRTRKANQ